MTNLFNYNPPCQPNVSAHTILRQLFQSNQPYYDYQKTDKKDIYQIDKNLVENQPKSFYTILEDESKNIAYSDKSFEDVAVNFVEIEALYTNCYAIFTFRSKLYNYLKSGYLEIISPIFST